MILRILQEQAKLKGGKWGRNFQITYLMLAAAEELAYNKNQVNKNMH